MSIHLPSLQPTREDPVYWALTVIFQLTDRHIRQHLDLSPTVIDRLRVGHDVKPTLASRLVSYLEQVSEQVALAAPDRKQVPDSALAYRDALFAFVASIVKDARDRLKPKPRKTDLSVQLLISIGRERRRRVVIAELARAGHSRDAIKKCAARLGVRSRSDDSNSVVWMAPLNHKPMDFHPDRPPPQTLIQQAACGALERFLSSGPRNTRTSKEVRREMQRWRISVRTTRRAALSLGVEIKQSGFGSSKTSTWYLPPKIVPITRGRADASD